MKRTFIVEFPDDHGDLWLNKDNLLTCLHNTCPNTMFTVWDITGDGCNREPATSTPVPHRNSIREWLGEAVARGWCHEKNKHKVMDPDLVEAIVEGIMIERLVS